jgi:predicted metal-dependent hydrolase
MLAYKPRECVEYVIIHELAHIVHPNHSKDFWNLVAQYCPDYRRLRRLLNNP